MRIQWVLHDRTPKPGLASQFDEISKMYAQVASNRSLSESQRLIENGRIDKALAAISRTPNYFDENFNEKMKKVDVTALYTSPLLSPAMRDRALLEQTAIGAYDYGTRLMRAVRMIDVPFSRSDETKFLRRTGMWLSTWGQRGFGYFVIKG